MPRTVSDVDTLQEYIQGVVAKADHHAKAVADVTFVLVGMIVWRKDADRELKVHEREGKMTNVLWVWIGGNRYAISYNRDLPAIEVRRDSTQGEPLAQFDNETPISEIKEFFANL